MSTRLTCTKRYRIAFVIDKDDLTYLDRKLEAVGHRNYTFRCADETSISCTGLTDALNIDNVPPRTVRSLLITAGDRDGPQSYVELELLSDSWSASVRWLVQAENPHCAHLERELSDFVSRIRVWYGLLGFPNIQFLAIALMPAAAAALISLWLASRLLSEAGDSIHLPIALPLLSSFFSLAIAILVVILRRWLFPCGIVSLGGGVREYERKRFWRNLIGVSFFVSLLASAVAAWVAK